MNFSRQRILLLLLIAGLWPALASAKRFSNQYTEFELPPGWECHLEGSEWICQSGHKDRKKEAIIILAAKTRGNKDDMDQYMAHLKKAKAFRLPSGGNQVSDPKYAKMATINGHRWIDALHLASEIPGFYTRYLATVKEDLGIAVTLSVSKDHYNSYREVFDKIVASLRAIRQKSTPAQQFRRRTKDEDLFAKKDQDWIDDVDRVGDIGVQRKGKRASGSGNEANILIWIILIAIAVGVFLKLRKRKK